MRFIILFCLSLCLPKLAQAQSETPFGVQQYGWLLSAASNHISFKGGNERKGTAFLAYLDLQYRNQAFSVTPPQSDKTNNRFYTGLEAAVNIPMGSYFLSGRYSVYLPNDHHYEFHPLYLDEREGTEQLTTFSINANKFHVFGSGRKKQIFYTQVGVENYILTYKYAKDNETDPTEEVSPKTRYSAYSLGVGHHFRGPWYWEFRLSYTPEQATNYTLGLGYRIFIKK
ncbi:MAG: hypothetical protein ACPGEC_05210 [Flavobacteriales bacterium]